MTHSSYLPLAFDQNDRLWATVTTLNDPNSPNYSVYHFRPAVMRTRADYLAPGTSRVTESSALGLGLNPSVSTSLTRNVALDLNPVTITLTLPGAVRNVYEILTDWHVRTPAGDVVAQGSTTLPLVDGQTQTYSINFTPPQYGAYDVNFQLFEVKSDGSKGELLQTTGNHLGFTPPFASMPRISPSDFGGGHADPARLAFVGHKLYRVNTNDVNAIETAIDKSQQYGLTLMVQFEKKEKLTDDQVRAVVERYQGRVKYWEIMNEPHYSMTMQEYVDLLKRVSAIIRSKDPQAKIMGPTPVNMDITRIRDFYTKLGPGNNGVFDILSLHDYEGHESIDPVHWQYKISEIRKIMAEFGDGQKEIWQTERGIAGVRFYTYMGLVQAVRVALHRNLLDSLGVPSEHNCHYYINEIGYSTVPTYLWSAYGPHPAALVLRTRTAMLGDRTLGKNWILGRPATSSS
jgi:hypothetical protein